MIPRNYNASGPPAIFPQCPRHECAPALADPAANGRMLLAHIIPSDPTSFSHPRRHSSPPQQQLTGRL